MRILKFAVLMACMLAVTGTAGATSVPLPSSNTGNLTVEAIGANAEIFVQVTDPNNPLKLPIGVYNNIGIGYSLNVDGAGTPGFVLYSGATSSTSAAPTGPTTILATDTTGALIKSIFTGTTATGANTNTIGRLFVSGLVNTITANDTANKVSYPIAPGSPGTQLTFSLYHAYVQNLQLVTTPGIGTGGQLETQFFLSGTNNVHFDMYADPTADVSIPGTGKRYVSVTGTSGATPELPVRDNGAGNTLLVGLDDGTYYDKAANGWNNLDFTGNPTDDDEVWWSWVGNTNSQFLVDETFDIRTGAESFTIGGITFYTSGPSTIVPAVTLIGQLTPGASPNVGKADAGGLGFGNSQLVNGTDYKLSGAFNFGGSRTGAYDSDPQTFTFQQENVGLVTLTQLNGLFNIPEPATMLGVFLAVGALGKYVRRRFA